MNRRVLKRVLNSASSSKGSVGQAASLRQKYAANLIMYQPDMLAQRNTSPNRAMPGSTAAVSRADSSLQGQIPMASQIPMANLDSMSLNDEKGLPLNFEASQGDDGLVCGLSRSLIFSIVAGVVIVIVVVAIVASGDSSSGSGSNTVNTNATGGR